MSSARPTDAEPPIRVKFLSKAQSADRDYDRWLRRLPGGRNRWDRCEFIFEQDCRNYDWLVVYDDLPRHPGQKKNRSGRRLSHAHANARCCSPLNRRRSSSTATDFSANSGGCSPARNLATSATEE